MIKNMAPKSAVREREAVLTRRNIELKFLRRLVWKLKRRVEKIESGLTKHVPDAEKAHR